MDFDAIVVGSGITGGWAAKELTEKGLKVLMIERGRMIEHQVDYTNEMRPPWELPLRGYGGGRRGDEWTADHFVDDRDDPYQTDPKNPFVWTRSYQLGGRSLVWGRQCYRWSDLDFGANAVDGHGCDWPVRYSDISPWYDHVEDFIGVSGSSEGLPHLPDGKFQPPMELKAAERVLKARIEQTYTTRKLFIGRTSNMTDDKPGRSRCQYRNICARGCSFGAYFSTQSSTLPAARDTGNLTLMTDSLVEGLDYDPVARRVTGARVINTKTRARSAFTARLVFLCAGSVNSVALLLRSANASFPDGLANSSGTLGRYFMDHPVARVTAKVPGHIDRGYYGNRPTGIVIPRFLNATETDPALLRGYFMIGTLYRRSWVRGGERPGLGKDLKQALRGPGEWAALLAPYVEALPQRENRISLDPVAKDRFGLPQTRIVFNYGENEHKLLDHAEQEAKKMLELIGARVSVAPRIGQVNGTHEMGGARMGREPGTSVLNAHNQAHDIPNLFVTDGAAMTSSGCVNPSLTYMAFTARAANYARARLAAAHI